jgi:hypothetical protein
VEAAYEEMPPEQDGGLLSVELGLRLVPEGKELALFEFRTGKRIPAPLDAYEQVLAVTRRAEEAERAAQEAERQRLEAERRGQELERQRLEAERRREDAVRSSQEADRRRLEAVRLAEQAEGRALEERRKAEQAQSRVEELQRELDRLRALLPPGGADSPGPA